MVNSKGPPSNQQKIKQEKTSQDADDSNFATTSPDSSGESNLDADDQPAEEPGDGEGRSDDEQPPSENSLSDYDTPTTRGIYYKGFKKPDKLGRVPNMTTFRKEMYDNLEGISKVQHKNIRSLEASLKNKFSNFADTLSTELQDMKAIMLSNAQTQASFQGGESFIQNQRFHRDDDLLMPGRQQMTEEQALSLDYLDGRRLNYFALQTSLAEVRQAFPQLLSPRDITDSAIRDQARNYRSKSLETTLFVDDIYDQQIWLKFHSLQSIVNRDLLPYNLWLPTIASRFGSQLIGFANSATKYGWNWVQFCAVIAHVRRASGFAQSSPGETVRQWRLSLNENDTLFEIVWQFNDLIPALPEQFSGQFIDLIQETFTLVSPTFWHHVHRVRTPQPGFSVALWWADIIRTAKMERFSVSLWNMTLKQVAPHIVNHPVNRSAIAPASQRDFSSPPITSAFPTETDKCHCCGGRGHWAKQCPSAIRQRYPNAERSKAQKSNSKHREKRRGKYFLNKKGKRVFMTYDDLDELSDDEERFSEDATEPKSSSEGDDDNSFSDTEKAFWVNVGRHDTEIATPPRDDGQHVLYPAYVEEPRTGRTRSVNFFLDNGSISCWVSESLAKSLQLTKYPATSVSTLSGIGKGGHRITHDALLHLFFTGSPMGQSADSSGYTGRVSVACGVIPDGIFPASLTLGKEFQHAAWTVANPDKTVSFLSFDVPVTLAPVFDGRRCYTTTSSPSFDYLVGFDSTLESEDTMKTTDKAFATSAADEPMTVRSFRERFPDLFSPTGKKIARASVISHCIDTGNAAPIRLPPRRYSVPQQTAINEFVQAGLAQGTIRPSNSPWSAPIHVVQKPDGRYRPCVDYRAVNNVTRKNAFPLPNVDDQIQAAAGHRLYTMLDLRDGFWQVPMSEESIEKTAFSTPDGHFEFLVMPFGLTNAPATFQEFMNRILMPVRHRIAGLLDDICIFGDSNEELEERTIQVLRILDENGLILQLRKCLWFQSSVRFLGLVINKDGIHTDPAKITAITERPYPQTVTELRSFIHAAAYFRRFIDSFSKIVSPLYELTKNSPAPGSKIALNDAHKIAVKTLTNALTHAPTLKKFDFRRYCVVDTDSSGTHIGGLLQQPYSLDDKDVLYPVCYESHKLTPTQQRYSAQEKELLAVVHCCIKWRHYIEGCDVTIRTDHESLTLLRSKTEQPARIQRFLNQIEHFDLTILYRPGKANRVPDWLSRPPVSDGREGHIQHIFPAEETSSATNERTDDARLSDTSLSDLDLEQIHRYLQDRNMRHDLNVSDEAIFRRFQLIDGRLCRITGKRLVDVENRDRTLQRLSDFHTTQGHPSVGTLERALQHTIWHPQYHLLAQEAIISCGECATRVPVNHLRQQFTPVPRQEPFAVWAFDYTGPLTHQGQRYHILCGIEYVTGLLLCSVTPSPSSQFAKSMLYLVRSCFPALQVLVSDNGSAFIDQDFRVFAKTMKVSRILSPPEYAARNGRVERAIGQLKSYLYKFMTEQSDIPFPTLVDRAKDMYNNSPQLHGFSPAFLTFGIEQWHPDSADLAEKRRALQNDTQAHVEQHPDQEIEDRAAAVFRADLKSHRQKANSAKRHRDGVRKVRLDKSALIHHFSPGDWVLRARTRNHKHEPFYDGPWRVTTVDPQKNTYNLQSSARVDRANPVHGTKLIPCLTYDGQPVQEIHTQSRHALEASRRHLDLLNRDQTRI